MNQPQTAVRTLALHALGIAMGYADAHTKEVGTNAGDQVEWFQHTTGGSKGDSWCADFVYACLLKSYCGTKSLLTGTTNHDNRVIMLAHADAMSAEFHIPRSGYCPDVADAAVKQFRFRSKLFAPSAGDLVLFDFHGQGEPHHIAFVVGRQTDGTIRTVEGNTGSGPGGSQGDGDGVYRRVRPMAHVFGYVHW